MPATRPHKKPPPGAKTSRSPRRGVSRYGDKGHTTSKRLSKFLIIAVIAMFITQMIANHRLTHQLIGSAINSILHDELGITVKIGRMQVGMFPPRLELIHTEIYTTDTGSSEHSRDSVPKDITKAPATKLLSVSHLVADLSIVSLLIGRIRLSEVNINHVLFHQHAYANFLPRLKAWNSSPFPLKTNPSSPDTSSGSSHSSTSPSSEHKESAHSSSYVFSLEHLIQRLTIIDGSFERTTFKQDQYIADLAHFDLRADLAGLSRGKVQLDLRGVRVQDDVFSYLEDAEIKGELRWQGDQIELASIEVADRRLRLNATSRAGQFSLTEGSIELNIEAESDLSLLGNFLSIADQLGQAKGSLIGTISWDQDIDYKFSGPVTVDNGMIRGFQLFDSQSELEITPTRLSFSRGVIKEEDRVYGKFDGQLVLSDKMPFNFNLSPQYLSVSKILEVVKVHGKIIEAHITSAPPGEFAQETRPVRIYGGKNPFSLTIEGRRTFRNLHISALASSFPEQDPTQQGASSSVAPPSYPDCFLDFKWVVAAKNMDFERSDGHCQFFEESSTSPPHSLDHIPREPSRPRGFSSPALTPSSPIHTRLPADPLSFFGSLDFSENLDLHVTLNAQDIAAYGPMIRTEIAGASSVKVHIAGTYNNTTVDIDASSPQLSLFSVPLGETKAELSLALSQNQLNINNIHSIPPRSELSGTKAPEGSSSSSPESFPPDSYPLELPSPTTPLPSLHITSGHYHYLRGEVQLGILGKHLPPTFLQSLVYRFGGPHLPANKLDLSAQLSEINVMLALPLKRIGELELSGRILGRDLQWNHERLLHHFDSQWQISAGTITLRPSIIDPSGSWPISISGEWSAPDHHRTLMSLPEKESRLALTWKSLHSTPATGPTTPIVGDHTSTDTKTTAQLHRLAYLGPGLKTIGLMGDMSFSGSLSGPLSKLSGTASLKGINTTINQHPYPLMATAEITRGEAQFNLGSPALNIEGTSVIAEGSFELTGSTPPTNLLPLLRQRLSQYLDPDTLAHPRNHLYLGARVRAKGKFSELQNWEAQLQLDRFHSFAVITTQRDIAVDERGWYLALRYPTTLTLKHGQLSLSRPLAFHSPDGQGFLDLASSTSLSSGALTLNARYDLSILSRFSRAITLSRGEAIITGAASWQDSPGTLSYSLRSYNKPGASSSLTFRNVSPPLKNISFDLYLSGDGLKVDRLSAQWEPGSITAKGFVPWPSASGPAETQQGGGGIDITLRQTRLQWDTDLLGPVVMEFGGDLEWSGTDLPYTLSGDLEVYSARSSRPLRLLRDIIASGSGAGPSMRNFTVSEESGLPMDLRIKAPQTLWVQNDPLDLNLSADLRVQGFVDRPEVSGFLEIPRGKVTYKRDYEITEGTMVFDTISPNDPILDVKARTDIDDYRISVSLRGRSKEPRFDFFADPGVRDTGEPLSRFDILYLMLNGSLPNPNQEADWARQQDIFISESVNLAIRAVNRELSEIIALSDKSLFKNISLMTFASPRTGDTTLRAVAPINTQRNDLDITLHGDPESVGLRAEYELDDHITTTLMYERYLDEQASENQTSVNEEASVGMRFRFSFR